MSGDLFMNFGAFGGLHAVVVPTSNPTTIADILLFSDKLKFSDPIPFGRRIDAKEGFITIAQTERGFYLAKTIGGDSMYLHPDGLFRTSAWTTDAAGKETRAYFPDLLTTLQVYLETLK